MQTRACDSCGYCCFLIADAMLDRDTPIILEGNRVLEIPSRIRALLQQACSSGHDNGKLALVMNLPDLPEDRYTVGLQLLDLGVREPDPDKVTKDLLFLFCWKRKERLSARGLSILQTVFGPADENGKREGKWRSTGIGTGFLDATEVNTLIGDLKTVRACPLFTPYREGYTPQQHLEVSAKDKEIRRTTIISLVAIALSVLALTWTVINDVLTIIKDVLFP